MCLFDVRLLSEKFRQLFASHQSIFHVVIEYVKPVVFVTLFVFQKARGNTGYEETATINGNEKKTVMNKMN